MKKHGFSVLLALALSACGGDSANPGRNMFVSERGGAGTATTSGTGGGATSGGGTSTGGGSFVGAGSTVLCGADPFPNPFSLARLKCDNFCYQEDAQFYYDQGAKQLDGGGVIGLACEDKLLKP